MPEKPVQSTRIREETSVESSIDTSSSETKVEMRSNINASVEESSLNNTVGHAYGRTKIKREKKNKEVT